VDLPHQDDLDHLLDLLHAHLLNRGVLADRRVVDPGIDASEMVHGFLRQSLDLRPDRDVGPDNMRLPADPLNLPGHLMKRLLVARGKHNGTATPTELDGRLPPNAARGTSDDNYLFAERAWHDLASFARPAGSLQRGPNGLSG
jgi:hypothetical protein